jgi:hypothetical protein
VVLPEAIAHATGTIVVHVASVEEKTCIIGVALPSPLFVFVILLIDIVELVAWATNLYHTSLGVAVVAQETAAGALVVADAISPAVLLQVVPEMSTVAPLQLSFTGCAKTGLIKNEKNRAMQDCNRDDLVMVFKLDLDYNKP